MDVGVRDLKKNLSAWLERASRGEVIRVTDRGRPKALLVPIPGQLQIERGVEEGWIRRGDESAPRPVTRQVATRRIAEVVDEDRGD